MKAAWYGRFGAAREVFEIGTLPDLFPGPGEVRVRLAASGINPSDVKSRAGLVRPLPGPLVIPHSDGAGVIESVGAGVSESHIGRRVWTFNSGYRRAFGTAAEYVVVPIEFTAALPDNLSYQEGACLGVPAMTAHACLFSQGPIRGKTILVSGGGGAVGNMAIQLGCWAGARVLATAGNEA